MRNVFNLLIIQQEAIETLHRSCIKDFMFSDSEDELMTCKLCLYLHQNLESL